MQELRKMRPILARANRKDKLQRGHEEQEGRKIQCKLLRLHAPHCVELVL